MSPPSLRSKDDWGDDAPCKQSLSGCSPPFPAPIPPYDLLPPPSPASSSDSHGRATFVTALIVAGSALAVVVLCLSVFLCVRRRRQRREALLEAALAPAAAAAPDVALELEEAGGEEVVHHAWHIRTVGLDEAAIESIALTRYRAGAALGASDCAVCLGEFADGELLRLLPRCAHAFHVRCIDTWLHAHVNCPLCRSHVLLDPATPAAAAAGQSTGSPPGTDADTGQTASGISTAELDRQANEQQELRVQIDHQPDGRTTSPEQWPSHPAPRGGHFRRVASMDSPSPIASAPEADELLGIEKQGDGGPDRCELLSPGCAGRPKSHRGMKRSLSVGSRWALVSRHCRRSSSLLPL